ncbi:hypothetical protein J3L16_11355 [Alteromonas sp. 5E99-2]|uniref:hypothetical protein n=1 Tax=Alteromonas sp. 5E99-2 TaxID=2817683 RepID=UPI001A9A2379|nr:hypothetical protein [Alteromonas sp. 5E99-2]MBO1256278.1 hypothetical protein [Alteromonas sp. 5E99-2]
MQGFLWSSLVSQSPISKEWVQEALSYCLDHVYSIFPQSQWAHSYRTLTFDGSKRCYGSVSNCGNIHINPAFLGTHAHSKLLITLIHEITHLVVGLRHKHNQVFKARFKQLSQGLQCSDEEAKQVLDNNGYKHRLIATDMEGKTIDLGGVLRRSKAYINYQYSPLRYRKVKGRVIQSFHYVDYVSSEY